MLGADSLIKLMLQLHGAIYDIHLIMNGFSPIIPSTLKQQMWVSESSDQVSEWVSKWVESVSRWVGERLSEKVSRCVRVSE